MGVRVVVECSSLRQQDTCLITSASLQLQTAKTPRVTSIVLQSARPATEECRTRNKRNPLPECYEDLSVGEDTIVRLPSEEKEAKKNCF